MKLSLRLIGCGTVCVETLATVDSLCLNRLEFICDYYYIQSSIHLLFCVMDLSCAARIKSDLEINAILMSINAINF